MNDNNVFPVSAIVQIQYCDSSGKASQRVISVRQFDRSGKIKAFCHSRNSIRTFIASRISDVVDVSSGEVIGDGDALTEFLMQLYQSSPLSQLRIWLQNHRHVIDMLIYVAKCDGKMITIERDKIVDLMMQQAGLNDELRSNAHDIVRQWHTPELSDFINDAAFVLEHAIDDIDMILEYANIVATADDVIHPNENNALKILENIFQTAQ